MQHALRSIAASLPLLSVLVVGAACSSSSTAPGGVDDTGGTVDTGAVDLDTGTAIDTGTPSADAPPGGCPKITAGTHAVHVTMQVTWPGSIGTEKGAGTVHVWTRSKFTIDGSNKITATNNACGSVIPDIQTTPIAGGGKVAAEFPAALWNAPSMPTFATTGTQSGYDVGSTVTMNPVAVILGLSMADPGGAWPALAGVTGVDSDGDGKPGITSVPKNGGGYSQPPTSLLRTARADKLYIASRTTSGTSGVRAACDYHKGTATVSHFENHVIGCHVAGAGECSTADYQFIDQNRTVYTVGAATYEAKIVPDTATCDDVRAALPAK